MVAKAIFDEIPLNLWLDKLIYRLILDPDASIFFEDIEAFDTAVYNSLKYMQENDIDGDDNFEFYFNHEFDGEMYPLVPDGNELQVTDDNKEEYIILKSEFMVKNFITPQIESIRKGFQKLIPLTALAGFIDTDFQYLCWGEDEIDIDDWKEHTIYDGEFLEFNLIGDYNANSNVIQWFWNYLDSCDQTSLRIIFQFVTGMSRLPAGGFDWLNKNRGEKQSFTIRSIPYEEKSSLPKAFTCFNRLHLPNYPDEDTLESNLEMLLEQNEVYGFGLED